MSLKYFLKSHVLSWRRKDYSDWEDVTSPGRAFQVFGPATGKARLPTVDRLTAGTRRRLVPIERATVCREDCVRRTGTSGPRYGGVLRRRTLNVSRAILIFNLLCLMQLQTSAPSDRVALYKLGC